MVNTKTIATVAVSVVLSLLGALALLGQGPTGPQGPAGNDGSFGSIASPKINSPWFEVNEVREWYAGQSNLLQSLGATSTACNIQSPAATTTIAVATLRIDTAPYATQWGIYRSAFPDTKTTQLAIEEVANNKGSIVATTTNTALQDGVVVPNSWISFIVATTTAVNANFQPTGKCSVLFREI